VRPGGTPEAGRFAPRTVDIDILFYGDEVISGPDDLHVPHLMLAERAFVLHPLSDVAPDFEHPTLYTTIRQLLDDLTDDHMVKPGAYPARWFED
jgi:7,8-dihydro-6-hydroxymethylpterin-pyrophosphokinase